MEMFSLKFPEISLILYGQNLSHIMSEVGDEAGLGYFYDMKTYGHKYKSSSKN
jgi:hypothetical protein